jgi:hypothetical protein
MADKRKEDRIIERNRVSIKPCQPGKKGPAINAYTHDISFGGARIFTKELFDVGSLIRIQIELARTNECIQLDGQVKWMSVKKEEDLFELGVEFRHRISSTILCLIRHIYQNGDRIPSSVA